MWIGSEKCQTPVLHSTPTQPRVGAEAAAEAHGDDERVDQPRPIATISAAPARQKRDRPEATAPTTDQVPHERSKRALRHHLSTGLHRPGRLSHTVVPNYPVEAAARPRAVDSRISPAHRPADGPAKHNHTKIASQNHRRDIPRRSTQPSSNRPETPSRLGSICQRQDETVSCQRYPHQFTGLHSLLSPAVDKSRIRTPQMWIKPGEIDVDRHEASRSCPPPVEGCGFPVEGSGEDEPVASQRCPHPGGQTPWISGG